MAFAWNVRHEWSYTLFFEHPLQEGILLKRSSQFTMEVFLDGTVVKCHCPTTGRIGNVDAKISPVWFQKVRTAGERLPYTVEAVSCDDLEQQDKNWIGINQVLSNRLVEYFLKTHQLDAMMDDYGIICREVGVWCAYQNKAGHTVFLHREIYEAHPRACRFPAKPERAILLTVYQYIVTQK